MGGYRPFSTLVDGRPEGEVFSEEFGQYINPVAEEMRFFGELKDIRKITDSFNLVMFPVDGRIGNGYTLGGRQFIEPTNEARAESQARLGYALQEGGRRSQPTNVARAESQARLGYALQEGGRRSQPTNEEQR